MSKKTFILCPGQGAQSLGMGEDFFEASPAAKRIFERANEIVGFDLGTLCFAGPEDRLNQTDVAQPAIFVTSIASYEAGKEAGLIDDDSVDVFAGLSLGEYTALHLAGAFDFETGLRLVTARGKFMQQAALATPSGMVSIIGADENAVQKLCADANAGDVLVPANYNAPGQIVVSGSHAACERVTKAAEAAGLRAIPLKVAGAFHSPLMQAAADQMAGELDRVEISSPNNTVYSNVTAQPHGEPTMIKKLLVDQIVKPVRWEQTMQRLIPHGDMRWVELAPGRVLTGLAKKINRRLPIESFATAEALKTQQSAAASTGKN